MSSIFSLNVSSLIHFLPPYPQNSSNISSNGSKDSSLILSLQYLIELPKSFLAEFGNSTTKMLWHPKLTIIPIEHQIKKQNSFLEIRNNEISESLRKVITLEKNSETGELSLSSTKLNCACKFIKNYENNTIDTAKALSSLPRFKETTPKIIKQSENNAKEDKTQIFKNSDEIQYNQANWQQFQNIPKRDEIEYNTKRTSKANLISLQETPKAIRDDIEYTKKAKPLENLLMFNEKPKIDEIKYNSKTAKTLENLQSLKEKPNTDEIGYNSKILNVEQINAFLLEKVKEQQEKLNINEKINDNQENKLEKIKTEDNKRNEENKIKKKTKYRTQKIISKPEIIPNIREETPRFIPEESFIQLPRIGIPNYPRSYPKYEDLLRFYLRKKEESYQNNRQYYLNSYYPEEPF